ncbi:MAG: hypothetical protein K9L86_07065 [Candidatus Omnitrophica bacterium]|nr:hypothetical protein [Candidatus Omnitrophota bacterium]
MFSFLLKILFFYLIVSFLFRIIIFFISLFASQVKPKSQPRGYQKSKKQPPKNKNVVDAEFREIK